jgi:hypothetical protein
LSQPADSGFDVGRTPAASTNTSGARPTGADIDFGFTGTPPAQKPTGPDFGFGAAIPGQQTATAGADFNFDFGAAAPARQTAQSNLPIQKPASPDFGFGPSGPAQQTGAINPPTQKPTVPDFGFGPAPPTQSTLPAVCCGSIFSSRNNGEGLQPCSTTPSYPGKKSSTNLEKISTKFNT